MEHLFSLAFLDFEFFKFSGKFQRGLRSANSLDIFFKYTILIDISFSLILSGKRKFVWSNFFFKQGGEVCNGWDKLALPDSIETMGRMSGRRNLCLLFDYAFMAGL